MDVRDEGGVAGPGRLSRRDGRGWSGRSRRRGGAPGVEALEGRTLLSTTITDVKSLAGGMTVGPMAVALDNRLWFAEQGHPGGPALAKLSAAGALTEVPLPAADALYAVRGVAADKAGDVWYTLSGSGADGTPTGKVGKVGPDGTITEYPLTTGEMPGGAVVGPDGNLWIAVTGDPGGPGIARITADGTETEFPVPGAHEELSYLTAGPDGNVWFVDNPSIGKISPSGQLTVYPLPAPADGSGTDLAFANLTAGSDGNLWFLGLGGVSRITPNGVVTTVPTPGGRMTALTSGSDGNLWMSYVPTPGTPLASTPGAVVARMTTDGQTTVLDDRVGGAGAAVPKMTAAGNSPELWIDEGGGKIAQVNVTGVPSLAPPIISPVNKGVLTTDANKTVSGRIATFQPTDGTLTAKDFQAVIDWNDGTVTPGTLVDDPQGGVDVDGSHTYGQAPVGAVEQANVTVVGPGGATATIFALTQITAPTPTPTPTPPWQQFSTSPVVTVPTPSPTPTTPVTTPVVSPVPTPVTPPVSTTPVATTTPVLARVTTPVVAPAAPVAPGRPVVAGAPVGTTGTVSPVFRRAGHPTPRVRIPLASRPHVSLPRAHQAAPAHPRLPAPRVTRVAPHPKGKHY